MQPGKKILLAATTSAVCIMMSSCGSNKDSAAPKGVEATSLAELKLANSFKISLPASLSKASGASAATNLSLATKLARKKSAEACRTVDQVKMLFSNLRMLGSTMCHLELESSRVAFGKKYKISLTQDGSTMDMPLWVDDSTPGALTIYTCRDGKLAEKIALTESNINGPKGSMSMRGSEDSGTYAGAMNFDFMTAGVQSLSGQFTFETGSDKFAQDSSLEFRDSGVSLLKTSNKGSMAGMTFSDRGAVKLNGTMGQTFFKGEGTMGDQNYAFSNRATFDSDGYTVENTTATSDVKVEASDLPAFLADGYAIPAATGWDCTTDENITVDADTAAHAACNEEDEGESDEGPDCWSEDFEQGEMVEVITE